MHNLKLLIESKTQASELHQNWIVSQSNAEPHKPFEKEHDGIFLFMDHFIWIWETD